MNEAEMKAHFEALNAHLVEVHPILDEFCARHGFQYVDRITLGRYPRIRIERSGSITLYFDLMMESRPEKFRPDLEYELDAGAVVTVEDGTRYATRLHVPVLCFCGKPFSEVPSVLQSEMESKLKLMEHWSFEYVLEHGEVIPLGR